MQANGAIATEPELTPLAKLTEARDAYETAVIKHRALWDTIEQATAMESAARQALDEFDRTTDIDTLRREFEKALTAYARGAS